MLRRIILFGLIFIAGFGALLYVGASAAAAQQPVDPDGTVLQAMARRATHPARYVVHRGQLLGVVQAPRLGLAIPLLEGADDDTLEEGAGHIPHTAFPGHHGNAGVAAHRDTSFRALRFVRPGDEIVITTPAGSYAYQVSGTEIVLPTDGRVLHRTRNRSLTLVTCYPFFYVGHAPKRFIVHAEERDRA
jgi:LPXTG-site transpeptidase (sortase) family protein